MIVGSGMLARAFRGPLTSGADVVVHAAGVSNSQCNDPREFARERLLLRDTLSGAAKAECFIYFSTCSINDPASADTPYVIHKKALETYVRAHPRHLILRLPQVAGHTPNPHTLLNYLYARIARGERFSIWAHARRNIIDCDDVRTVGFRLIETGVRGETINIASSRSHSLTEIVNTLERVTGGHAVYDVIDRGNAYTIDISRIQPLLEMANISFEDDYYLERVLRKYYANR